VVGQDNHTTIPYRTTQDSNYNNNNNILIASKSSSSNTLKSLFVIQSYIAWPNKETPAVPVAVIRVKILHDDGNNVIILVIDLLQPQLLLVVLVVILRNFLSLLVVE
jgi:hypothetical protein